MSKQQSQRPMFMMPVHFGPTCGPRQAPDGGRYINRAPQKQRKLAVSFLTEAAPLRSLLPPGFTGPGDSVVTVVMSELRDIPWLAGRGYNTLSVVFPATYIGSSSQTDGLFLSVIWENLADPIITGREQLGYNKIFADIEDIEDDDRWFRTAASWDGFEFLTMAVDRNSLVIADPAEIARRLPGEGLLHYKYIPETGGDWQGVDAEYATLSPWQWEESASLQIQPTMPEFWLGSGEVVFQKATWDQMPTQFRIVNALAELPIVEFLGAMVSHEESAQDYRYQRKL